MSDSLDGWQLLGQANVNQSTHKIKLIDSLFEVGIFTRDQERCYFAYDEVTGIPVLSNKKLEDDYYHTVDDNVVNQDVNESGSYNYTVTIPMAFFPPKPDDSIKKKAEKVDEAAYIRENNTRYFVFNADLDMHLGDVRSVYLLTADQMMDRQEDPEKWGDSFTSKPQFF